MQRSLINNKYFVSLFKMSKKKNIAILTGGDSAEHDISILSANTVLNNLDSNLFNGYIIHLKKGEFTAIINEERTTINKADFTLKINKKISFYAVFMALHGPPAENGMIQSYFDKLNIPYTSCNSSISKLTFNKYKCNEKLSKLGFNCPKSYIYKNNKKIQEEYINSLIGTPCFIKPNKAGSSYGISKVNKKGDLKTAIKNALKYDDEVLIEQYISGLEVSVGVFYNGKSIESLPVTEIISENDFFDYEAKYKGKSQEITPARITKELTESIQETTRNIYKRMNLSGICRVDYIIQKNNPFIIEINTIPGLSKESIIPKQLESANINLSDFFALCLNNLN